MASDPQIPFQAADGTEQANIYVDGNGNLVRDVASGNLVANQTLTANGSPAIDAGDDIKVGDSGSTDYTQIRHTRSDGTDDYVSSQFLNSAGDWSLRHVNASQSTELSKIISESFGALEFQVEGTQYLSINGGGPVEVENTDLRIATGQTIEDGSGTNRLSLLSTETRISDDGGATMLKAVSGGKHSIFATSAEPFVLDDNEGGFQALKYTTASTAGEGTFDINADVEANSVSTEREHITRNSPIVVGSVGWRSDFDGADADTRLDNAINAAQNGDTIYLEPREYSDSRSISKAALWFIGTGTGSRAENTYITGGWTFNSQYTSLKNARIDTNALTLDGFGHIVKNCRPNAGITVNVDECRLSSLQRGSVTFASGTSKCIIDASTDVAVTDNGTNTVGDIA